MRIIITCFDTKMNKWTLPNDSGQMSSSMPIDQAFEEKSNDPKELFYHSSERYKFFVKVEE